MTRALVVATGPLEAPSGSAIRALEIARQLREHADVTLAAAGSPSGSVDGMPCVGFHTHDPSGLEQPLASADLVLSTPRWPRVMRAFRRSRARLVFDLYDPEPLELVPGFPGLRPSLRRLLTQYSIDRVVEALRIGDRFICASERQRDLWLGTMLAERLVDLDRYDHDPSLRSLIDVVPIGIPSDAPRPGGAGARERFPAIGPDDEVILWNGGLWPWLDAETTIRAVALLAPKRPVRLVFMAAVDSVPAQRATEEARRLAADLDLLDSSVFFNERWEPYEQRAGWLLGADCGIWAHRDHLETRFSFRGRLLDCLWSGLPVVCTGGDELAELVDSEGLGAMAPPGDPGALAGALDAVLARGRESFADAFERVRPRFAWSEVVRPLVRWLGEAPPPRARPRAPGPAEAFRRVAYLGGRRVLDVVGVRDWPRV